MYCATKRRWHLSARRSMHRKHTFCRQSRVNNFSGARAAKISLNSRTYPAQSVTPLLYRANKSALGANCGTDLYRAPRIRARLSPPAHGANLDARHKRTSTNCRTPTAFITATISSNPLPLTPIV